MGPPALNVSCAEGMLNFLILRTKSKYNSYGCCRCAEVMDNISENQTIFYIMYATYMLCHGIKASLTWKKAQLIERLADYSAHTGSYCNIPHEKIILSLKYKIKPCCDGVHHFAVQDPQSYS